MIVNRHTTAPLDPAHYEPTRKTQSLVENESLEMLGRLNERSFIDAQ